ncbi:hypothetical protein [Actinoplanes sp. NPDC051851]|uniref:hypothetical protein n=1 Tax=Actinoplanes sp. NPDC051851 TaxID=3154753 RepID=UPI00343AFFDD
MPENSRQAPQAQLYDPAMLRGYLERENDVLRQLDKDHGNQSGHDIAASRAVGAHPANASPLDKAIRFFNDDRQSLIMRQTLARAHQNPTDAVRFMQQVGAQGTDAYGYLHQAVLQTPLPETEKLKTVQKLFEPHLARFGAGDAGKMHTLLREGDQNRLRDSLTLPVTLM